MRLNPAFRPSISMNFTAAPVRGCAPKLLSMEAVSKPLPGIRQQTFELALSKRAKRRAAARDYGSRSSFERAFR